ncbi:D-alanyl-D-alanine carboxypeptidase [Limibacter armeniacum]|uniref:D-alanyl-D-alanine carboxypeptidase n=1 Tax=Limibacter armeniacum TaxID=466084 RepID=UPI002FE67CC5
MRFPRVVYFFLLIVAVSCNNKVHRLVHKDFTKHAVLSQNFSGLAIYDPGRREMLYEENADKYFTPASNTKIYTFFTSLEVLGDSIPGLKYITRGDSLIFWGTGDPSLLNPNMEQTSDRVFDFLKSRPEKLFYANKPYSDPSFGPGWAWDDYNDYYSAERSPFPVFGNVVSGVKEKGGLNVSLTPSFFTTVFEEGIYEESAYTKRDKNDNRFIYAFKEEDEWNEQVPFIWSSELAIELLSDTLHKEIAHFPFSQEFYDESVQTVYSIPTDTLLKRMMLPSDNFIAEQLLLVCHDALTDTLASSEMIDIALDSILNDLPDRPRWVDGSGLSRYNLFTPRNTVYILNKLYQKLPEERIFEMFPAGGKSGTLKNYYKADVPYIYAKTGSFSNNHSLSGYLITKKGKRLIFSFMHNNYMVSSRLIKQVMEEVLIKLRDNY